MDINMNIDVNKIDKATVSLSDVFIIKIPFEKYSMETMRSVYDAFKYCFPDNHCMLIPDDCKIHIANKLDNDFMPATQDELFAFLNIKNQEERELNGQPEVQN